MRTILVTGASGFIGSNLVVALRRQPELEVLDYDIGGASSGLPNLVQAADRVFHLAGVNRPQDPEEFISGNIDLTQRLCSLMAATGRRIPVVLSSSIQAESDNPYGRSKSAAEEVIRAYGRATGSAVRIYRLPNVFGKWSRPNYNTVVATFCYNVSRGLPVHVADPDRELQFVHIRDLVDEFVSFAMAPVLNAPPEAGEVAPVHRLTIGGLHRLIMAFRDSRERRVLPDLSDPLVHCLYSTYLSFLDPEDLARPVELRRDDRGWLFEWIKSKAAGQVFVSLTRPGVTRGNHYHDVKVEKFCVIAGEGMIRFRPIRGGDSVDYPVSSASIRVVDIPPGYVHSIENQGTADMLTLFWASEVFDPDRPDTYAAPRASMVPAPGGQQ